LEIWYLLIKKGNKPDDRREERSKRRRKGTKQIVTKERESNGQKRAIKRENGEEKSYF
jgi:hypothetical protein